MCNFATAPAPATNTAATPAPTPSPACMYCCLQQLNMPAWLSVWVEQHKVQGVIGTIQVTEVPQGAIPELHTDVAAATHFSVTCAHKHT